MKERSPAQIDGKPLLEVENLNVAYGHVSALSGVSLQVHAGEAVALVGANGAGKTTLFRAIVGQLKPRSGAIRISGHSITGYWAERRIRMGLGYAPEGRRVFPGLSVRENLEVAVFGGRIDRSELIDFAFELFPALKERQHSLGWQLSGGQQQMLAIARALMGRPSLLLLDEPSLGLSPKIAEEVFQRMEGIRSNGTAILLAEQNVTRALQYCDRAYVLEVGKIALSGSSRDLRNDDAVRKAYLGG